MPSAGSPCEKTTSFLRYSVIVRPSPILSRKILRSKDDLSFDFRFGVSFSFTRGARPKQGLPFGIKSLLLRCIGKKHGGGLGGHEERPPIGQMLGDYNVIA